MAGFIDSLRSELIHQNSHIHITSVQMPALNTPQFGWARNKMPNRAQPVPPIFQPEVAADAILFAASHRRRNVTVGSPTWLAEWGQKFVPGLLDHYLARAAWNGQQTDESENPGRADNLFKPVAGDPGTRGTFSERSSSNSPALWFEENRKWVVGATVIVGVLAALGWLNTRSQSGSARGLGEN